MSLSCACLRRPSRLSKVLLMGVLFVFAMNIGSVLERHRLTRHMTTENETTWFTTHPPPSGFSTNGAHVKSNGDVSKRETEISNIVQTFVRVCQKTPLNVTLSAGQELCDCENKNLLGRLDIEMVPRSWASLAQIHAELAPGGKWKPSACVARQRVAIVIPFRDRMAHLQVILHHLHPILQRQQLEYQIFVIEQAAPHIFNKAALMNIGFLYAEKTLRFDCIVFQDVDMLLVDDRQPYWCLHSPEHKGAFVDKFGYGRFYVPWFGGVTAFTPEHYRLVNGFSNLFFGWGGEDDDMRQRIRMRNLKISRSPVAVAQFRMMNHRRDARNPTNPKRVLAYKYRPMAYQQEGLNSMRYTVHESQLLPLYTWVLAEAVNNISQFRMYNGTCRLSAAHAQLSMPINECADACISSDACVGFVYNNALLCTLMHQRCTHIEKSTLQMYYDRKAGNKEMLNGNDTHLQSKLDTKDKRPTSYTTRQGDCRGGDITSVHVTSVKQCFEACAQRVECLAFAFRENVSGSTANCWPKYATCQKTVTASGVQLHDVV